MTINELLELGRMGYNKSEIAELLGTPTKQPEEVKKEEKKEEEKTETPPDYVGEIKELKKQIAELQKTNIQRAEVETLQELQVDDILRNFIERKE